MFLLRSNIERTLTLPSDPRKIEGQQSIREREPQRPHHHRTCITVGPGGATVSGAPLASQLQAATRLKIAPSRAARGENEGGQEVQGVGRATSTVETYEKRRHTRLVVSAAGRRHAITRSIANITAAQGKRPHPLEKQENFPNFGH